MHDLYARFRSAIPIADVLNGSNLKTHRGTPFNQTFVRRILQNRLYRGERAYLGKPYPGIHHPVISERVWARTESIKDASPARRGIRRPPLVGLLDSLLHSRGELLIHVGGRTKGKVYRYYELAGRRKRADGERVERFRALELERSVLATLDPECRLRSPSLLPTAARQFVHALVERIDIEADMLILLRTGSVIRAPVVGRTDTLEEKRDRDRGGRFSSAYDAELEPGTTSC